MTLELTTMNVEYCEIPGKTWSAHNYRNSDGGKKVGLRTKQEPWGVSTGVSTGPDGGWSTDGRAGGADETRT